jgi:hypothetical protein
MNSGPVIGASKNTFCGGEDMKTEVLTRSYDNARTGANNRERVLTPAAIASGGLKKLFSMRITDDARGAEAQPLIVPDVTMPHGTKHDVVYLCSMANTVWAFDANDGSQLWADPVSLGKPIQNTKSIDVWLINDHWGILSTPVIDRESETMYVVSYSSPDGTQNNAAHHLHALRLRDGKHRKPPIPVLGTMRNAAGQQVALIQTQKQRAALLLVRSGAKPNVHKTLFVAFTGGEHPGEAHGWVIAFDVESFQQTAAWTATPNSWGGGIWQGSQGPSADEEGNVYLMTGNGGWDGTMDFAETVVKLNYTLGPQGNGALAVTDWFTPFTDASRQPHQLNYRGYDWTDQDLGSSGPVFISGLGLIIGAGKDGILYVLDRNNLGKTNQVDLANPIQNYQKLKSQPIFFTYFPGWSKNPGPANPQDLNFLTADLKTHHLHASPVYWDSAENGPMLFCWGENENLRAWSIAANGVVTFLAKGAEVASLGCVGPFGHGGMPGGLLCLSANAQQPHTGIVWALAPINGDANSGWVAGQYLHVVEGILRAYDATQFDTNPDGSKTLRLLWDSKRIPGNTFSHNKFGVPVVANGKVYVPTYDGRVDVYGV